MATSERGGAPWDGARYDLLANPQTTWGKAVLARLDLHGDETVLDAGCGSGRVTEELLVRLPRGRVIAVDSSPSMLDEARRRLDPSRERVRFVLGDLLALSPEMLGEGAPCDAVLSTATFHWVTDHERLFEALAATIRSGGQLVAQCGGEGNLDHLLEAVRSLGVERAGSWYYAGAEETARRLEAAGFADVQVWLQHEPTPFASHAVLADFLEAVCLRDHLALLEADERRDFAEAVTRAMGEPMIDYVRLNIVARRT